MSSLSRLVGWVLAGFYSLIPNYAIAIILVGLVYMSFVVPFTLKSTRSMLAMQKLQPKMKQLQQQHKDDRLALNQALTELYKQEGVNPFGACIPTLLPLPLLYVLYSVIRGLSHTAKVCGGKVGVLRACPSYLSPSTRMFKDLVRSAPQGMGAQMKSFGINLSNNAWADLHSNVGVGATFGALLLLVIMTGANYYQQVQIMSLNPMVRQNQQMNSQMRIMRFFPILFGVLCIRFATGLVLYYAVSGLFRVGQTWAMYHYDPKVKALVARDDRDLEVMESHLEEVEGKSRKALPKSPPAPPSAAQKALPKPPPKTPPKSPPKTPTSTGDVTPANGKPNGRPNGGKPSGPPNGQRPIRNPNTEAASQRNRNRRRKGR
ncbi:MAG TPA: YidC/Oxa1 family membrane protein insertase [Acidimicrobiales bacterium]|nr:YidC/Oxa1 family membrane protein insertase [Acidimicrobiales bacterium]